MTIFTYVDPAGIRHHYYDKKPEKVLYYSQLGSHRKSDGSWTASPSKIPTSSQQPGNKNRKAITEGRAKLIEDLDEMSK